MPKLFQKISNLNNERVSVSSLPQDGSLLPVELDVKRLLESDNILIKKIKEGGIDVICLQEMPKNFFKPIEADLTFKSILKLDSVCQLYGCRLIVFQPYISPVFPRKYCSMLPNRSGVECSEEFTSLFQVIEKSHAFFKKLKSYSNVEVAYVGDVFAECSFVKNDFSLYSDDVEFHPSVLGSYLIAGVYFTTCFKKEIAKPIKIRNLEANYIEEATKIVNNNLHKVLK
jgi:hypothetical protein